MVINGMNLGLWSVFSIETLWMGNIWAMRPEIQGLQPPNTAFTPFFFHYILAKIIYHFLFSYIQLSPKRDLINN
jgi:hypothetical protein